MLDLVLCRANSFPKSYSAAWELCCDSIVAENWMSSLKAEVRSSWFMRPREMSRVKMAWLRGVSWLGSFGTSFKLVMPRTCVSVYTAEKSLCIYLCIHIITYVYEWYGYGFTGEGALHKYTHLWMEHFFSHSKVFDGFWPPKILDFPSYPIGWEGQATAGTVMIASGYPKVC